MSEEQLYSIVLTHDATMYHIHPSEKIAAEEFASFRTGDNSLCGARKLSQFDFIFIAGRDETKTRVLVDELDGIVCNDCVNHLFGLL